MTQFEIILTSIAILTFLSVLGLLLFFWTRRNQDRQAGLLLQHQVAEWIALQDNRLSVMNEQVTRGFSEFNNCLNQRFTQNQQLAQQTQQSMAERLESAGKTMADVRGQLGQLSQAAQHISQVGAEMRKLQDILQSPKLRGSLGEWSLDNLLGEVLPQAHYQLQYGFQNGVKVDAVVKLIDGMVCIDAKFPLPNFVALLEATGEGDQIRARKAFYRDVRARIDEIASKYILPDQGTLDFALMYIPAENVYYEIISAGGEGAGLCAYARHRKVIPVSPNSLYAYLMVIATGLKGLQLEKNAHLIQARISDLTQQLRQFYADFVTTGKHLNNASLKFSDSQRKLDKLTSALDQIDSEKPC